MEISFNWPLLLSQTTWLMHFGLILIKLMWGSVLVNISVLSSEHFPSVTGISAMVWASKALWNFDACAETGYHLVFFGSHVVLPWARTGWLDTLFLKFWFTSNLWLRSSHLFDSLVQLSICLLLADFGDRLPSSSPLFVLSEIFKNLTLLKLFEVLSFGLFFEFRL